MCVYVCCHGFVTLLSSVYFLSPASHNKVDEFTKAVFGLDDKKSRILSLDILKNLRKNTDTHFKSTLLGFPCESLPMGPIGGCCQCVMVGFLPTFQSSILNYNLLKSRKVANLCTVPGPKADLSDYVI